MSQEVRDAIKAQWLKEFGKDYINPEEEFKQIEYELYCSHLVMEQQSKLKKYGEPLIK